LNAIKSTQPAKRCKVRHRLLGGRNV
jgi:hypothetical protein